MRHPHAVPRKGLILVLLVLLAVCLCGTALAKTVVVTGGSLRLRSEPSTGSAVLAVYPTGTQMTVLATSGSWTRVLTPDGKNGWMLSSYLTDSGSGGSTATGTAYITSANGLGVNLRAGAGYGYQVLTQLAVGTKVNVLGSDGGWARVTVGSYTGYVDSSFITSKQPSSTTPAVTGTAYVTSGNGLPVRLRAAASTAGAVLISVPVGTKVEVLSAAGGWSRVNIGTRSGYMMSQYLTSVAPTTPVTPTTTPTSTSYKAWVTSLNKKGVRLRSAPNTGNNIITEVPYAAQITVTGESGGYYQIKYGTLTGYMQKAYVTTIQPTTPADSSGSGLQAGGVAWITNPNGQKVNLRKGAGTNYGVISSYVPGTQVSVLQAGTYWCKISISGAEGWMMTQYLTATKPGSPAVTPQWTGYVNVSGLSVNLRAAASTNSEKLGEYAIGTQLTVLETQGQWSLVSIGGTTGWMMTKFISTTKPATNGVYTGWIRSSAGDYVIVYQNENSYSNTVMSLKVGTPVVVTGSASAGFRRITYSGKTGYVSSDNISTAPVAAVKISAEISRTNPRVGNKLSVKVTPAGIPVSYVWVDQNGKVLSTTDSYVVEAAEVGKTIRVRVTGTGSVSGTYTTDATDPVQK